MFEVRLYPTDFTVPNLLDKTIPDTDTPTDRIVTSSHHAVDTRKLTREIGRLDYAKVRARRRQYVRLFNEAKMSQDPRGVSFTAMLLMLAHYTLIDDEKALQVDELLIRRARMERVEDLVSLDRVRGLLRTIYWRRRFLRHRQEKRLFEARQSGAVPTIILEETAAVPGYAADPLTGKPVGDTVPEAPPLRSPPPAYPYAVADPLDAYAAQHAPAGSVFTHLAMNSSTTSYASALSTVPELGQGQGRALGPGPGAGTGAGAGAGGSPRSRSVGLALASPGSVGSPGSPSPGTPRTSMSVSVRGSPRHRDSVFVEEREDELLGGLAGSAWADMMADAVDEEEDSE